MTSTRSRVFGGVALVLGFLAGPLGTAGANDSLMQAAADGNNWPMYGRSYDNTHFSSLNQISAQNASQLKLAFAFQLGSLRSNESTPLVVGDTLVPRRSIRE